MESAKPTKEWIELWKKSQKCKKCGVPVSLEFKDYGRSTFKIKDLDGEKVRGYFCSECVDMATAELMNERFVEVYKGNTIYCKNGMYAPYWGSPYYFETLEDCRTRIDNKHIAIMPSAIMSLLLNFD